MRALVAAGLCVLSVACADGGSVDTPRTRTLSAEVDGGTDAGPEPDRCDWIVRWRTDIYQDEPCLWRIRSLDTTLALLRPEDAGSTCLAEASICGLPACADLAEIREKEIVAVWGPPDIDPETVWSATESFDCK